MIPEKRKIAFIITKLELGGAQKHVLELIRGIDKERFEVFMFTASSGMLLDEAESLEGARVVRSKNLERPLNPVKDLFAAFELFRFFKKNRIGIVHTHSSKAGILGRCAAALASVPVIVHTVHGWSFNDHQPRFLRTLYILLERFCARFTSSIIVVSEADRRTGLSFDIGKDELYRVIPYGIDPAEFGGKDASVREELGLKPGEKLVVTVACLKPQKAPLDFVRCAGLVREKLPSTRFALCGDGELRPAVERLAAQSGLDGSLALLGWRRDVARVLAAADLFVLCSLWEGLPIVVMEAMAAGLAVVVTDTGGVKELVEASGAGYVAARGDVKGQAEKVSYLLEDDSARAAAGAAGKNFCRSLPGADAMSRAVYSLYG